MIHVSSGKRSRSPFKPLSLRMMSRADLSRLPSDWAVVGATFVLTFVLGGIERPPLRWAQATTRRCERIAEVPAGTWSCHPQSSRLVKPFHRPTAWFSHLDPSLPRPRRHGDFSICIQERFPSSSTLQFRNALCYGAQEPRRSTWEIQPRELTTLAAISSAPPKIRRIYLTIYR